MVIIQYLLLFIQTSTQLEQQWLPMWNNVRRSLVWWTTTHRSKVMKDLLVPATFSTAQAHCDQHVAFLQEKRCKSCFSPTADFRVSHIFLILSLSLVVRHLSEVRCQLADQLKVLDLQLEQKSQQLQDLTDYLRRRGEIESEYARSLEKLAERFTSRIKR